MEFVKDITTRLEENDSQIGANISQDEIDLSTNINDDKAEILSTSLLNEDTELFAVVNDATPTLSSSLSSDIVLLPGGENNYNFLTNRPVLNGKIIEGEHDSDYYGLGCYYTDTIGSDALGGISQGEKFNKISVVDLLYKLLHKYQQPIISIGLAPTKTIYDCVNESIPNLKITANVTKRSKDIQWIKIYFNNELWETFTEDVKDGGSYSVDKTFSTPITGISGKQYKAKAECYDGQKIVSTEATIIFVGKSYVGVLEETVEITADAIKTLDTKLKNTKELEYTFNTEGTELYHIVYSYPKHLGEISSIKDGLNFENYNTYDKSEITIDGTVYYLYVSQVPVAVTDYTLKFT